MGTISNIRVEPCDVTWGEDVAQVTKITAVADNASSLNDTYFFLYAGDNATKYYVWLNVGAGGTDPAITGATGIEVTLTANDTAADVADAVKTAIDSETDFSATVSSAVVTVTNAANGYATAPYEGDSATGFSFEVTTQGMLAEDAGYLEGDIEISGLGEDTVAINAHQEGTDTLGHIRTGFSEMTVAVTFKETSVSQLRKIFVQGGGAAYTPDGTSSTEVFGLGTSKRFTQTLTQAKKLVLHPRALGSSDKSRDMTFWKAYPQLDSIAKSGESEFGVSVTFTLYPDSSKVEQVRYFAYGDGSQTLT